MAEYKHGSMDITDHEKTFDGFIRFSTIVAGLAILVIVFIGLVNG
ncbi:MAG: aa3-type cytochrome c oxidase subunit IV [Confluentimicrobium sp.]|jgi:hypothetical protein|nr:aa3-type cytochrome c oxidase subunit IV [Actibacterium sp.]KGB82088.1 cytochrome C oxidase subunit IV [Rhodovulum sp. NI22]MBC58318.1 aa3-type cytochrome c oxidase subunit IV [Actibacterium sp.]MDY6858425.1 aa3-type cytochrome c oxidase subunit IV [Pseudomonadota bacterium]|tara:strand:- start:1062 stop:1196 length:135 start_codon:yes stop_codon:yes gene_type:complete